MPSCSARIRPAIVLAVDAGCRPPTSSTRPGAIGIPAAMLGVTGGDALILPGEQAISVEQLKAAHEAWLPDYMAGKA